MGMNSSPKFASVKQVVKNSSCVILSRNNQKTAVFRLLSVQAQVQLEQNVKLVM
ncbi:hypothetical protein [Bacillus cereus]